MTPLNISADQLQALGVRRGGALIYSTARAWKFSKPHQFAIEVYLQDRAYGCTAQVGVIAAGDSQLQAVVARTVDECWSPAVLGRLKGQLTQSVQELLNTYQKHLAPDAIRALFGQIQQVLAEGIFMDATDDAPLPAKSWLSPAVLTELAKLDARVAQAVLQLNDYPQSFALARSMGRQLHAKLGPTNSGKTWAALNALAAAPSGVYLAPLRLLALEIRDRLMEQGVPCSLLTGEEQALVPGARHIACTIEMLNPTEPVDVAVIDEIQMLADASRGWAWTAALVGAPAREVYLCGSAACAPALAQMAAHLAEPLTVEYLLRKNALEVDLTMRPRRKATGRRAALYPAATSQLDADLRAGDAVIAFKRRDVLTLSARYRKQGWTVATIYGALAPEVRRAEAARFAKGEAKLLVATDAIGMGLNLPIRRILFSAVTKFDGQLTRALLPTEVQQIGGRAGRYGSPEKGLVACLDPQDMGFIQAALGQPLPEFQGPLSIAPNQWHLAALAHTLATDQVGVLFSFFATHIKTENPYFTTSRLDAAIVLGKTVDDLLVSCQAVLPLPTKFLLACAPVDPGAPLELKFFGQCVRALTGSASFPVPTAPRWLTQATPGQLEQAEQLHKLVSIYAWLSFKFPQIFCDGDKIAELRRILATYIEAELTTQQGYGLTALEAKRSQLSYR